MLQPQHAWLTMTLIASPSGRDAASIYRQATVYYATGENASLVGQLGFNSVLAFAFMLQYLRTIMFLTFKPSPSP